jgi:hypothetical protein
MNIQLFRPRVLTDEQPNSAKGKLAIDLDIRKTYQPEDRIMGVSVQPAVSLPVEEMGGNNFLPEEIRFISQFKEGDQEDNRSVRPAWEIWQSLSKRK